MQSPSTTTLGPLFNFLEFTLSTAHRQTFKLSWLSMVQRSTFSAQPSSTRNSVCPVHITVDKDVSPFPGFDISDDIMLWGVLECRTPWRTFFYSRPYQIQTNITGDLTQDFMSVLDHFIESDLLGFLDSERSWCKYAYALILQLTDTPGSKLKGGEGWSMIDDSMIARV